MKLLRARIGQLRSFQSQKVRSRSAVAADRKRGLDLDLAKYVWLRVLYVDDWAEAKRRMR